MRSISLGSNIASLQAQRRLSENADGLAQTFERLSSGMRINRASDDAAGLAVQSSLNLDKRVFSQGVRNVSDGLSLLNIADSTLAQGSNIVTRLRELAEQASSGTFGTQQRKSLDNEAQALAAEFLRITQSAKFNGLGIFDGSLQGLRLQSGYGENGSIFSSLGGARWNGGFDTSSLVGSNSAGQDVINGDLDGDGNQDIVTVTSTGISVRFGIGDGSFATETTYDMGLSTGNAVALGDFNGDGVLDVVAGGILSTGGAGFAVRLGQGNGTFSGFSTFSTVGTSVRSIAIGDLNNDGNQDIIAGTQNAVASDASVLLGDGRGGLGTRTDINNLGGVTGVFDLQLADLNGDGILDLLTTGSSAANLQVSLGVGDGTFATSSRIDSGFGSNFIRLKDLNGDGKLDAVSGSGTNILVSLGNGNGSFGAASTFAAGGTVNNLRIADVDGDGRFDFVAALSGGNIGVLSGNGNGTFGASGVTSIQTSSITGLALGDFNNDGVLDVLASNTTDGTNIRKSLTKDGISPIVEFSLQNMANARQALMQFTNLGSRLSLQRGIIGAFQSRLDVASAVLSVAGEQSTAAESRIRDVDVAQESAELVRKNILQRAAASVLAQANQQPALALQLLQ